MKGASIRNPFPDRDRLQGGAKALHTQIHDATVRDVGAWTNCEGSPESRHSLRHFPLPLQSKGRIIRPNRISPAQRQLLQLDGGISYGRQLVADADHSSGSAPGLVVEEY